MFLRKLVNFTPNRLTTQVQYGYFNREPSNFDAKKDYYNTLNLSKSATDS